MNKIKVMVADDVAETREVIKKILSIEKDKFEIAGEAANGEEVLKLIPIHKPDIVLMDINMPIMNGFEATEKISEAYPLVSVIIMSVQAEREYLKKAMFCGAKEYIIKPFNYSSLVDTITATYTKQKERLISNKSYEEVATKSKIITFYSAKGGVGKTVLSTNSAITLSQTFRKKTLLLDMDLQYGDISMLVNQHTEKTILDIIDDGQLINYTSIKPYFYSFNENLDILLAPRDPEKAEYISKDIIEKLIDLCKNHYEFIIIDTGVNFHDITLYLLDNSQMILLVTNMDITSLKDTKLGLGVMESLNYDNDKVKIIINQFTGKYGVTKKDVETIFGDKIFSMILEDPKIVKTSINKGIPFSSGTKYGGTKIVKDIHKMCKNIL